jgi:hypothetical protein
VAWDRFSHFFREPICSIGISLDKMLAQLDPGRNDMSLLHAHPQRKHEKESALQKIPFHRAIIPNFNFLRFVNTRIAAPPFCV